MKSPFVISVVSYIVLVSVFVVVFNSDLFYAIQLVFVQVVAIHYLISNANKTPFFTLFLVLFSIANAIDLVGNYFRHEAYYFLGSFLYIIAYVFLFLEILRTVEIRKLLKNHFGQLLVLLALDGFIIYALTTLINPIDFETTIMDYYIRLIEHIFNLILLLVFSISFLNYLQKNNNKSLFMFIACLAIMFSEILLIGYYYFSGGEVVNAFSIFLMATAFVLFSYQSTLLDVDKSDMHG